MSTFHHGGRIGDLIFALYTMKQLGGGLLFLSDYHKPNWDLDIAKSLDTLLRQQDYIQDIQYVHYSTMNVHKIDYDLQHAEDDYNPSKFPEWIGPQWPGNANICKRYAVHFGIEHPPKEAWLTVPNMDIPLLGEVVLHLPRYRLVRKLSDWYAITGKLLQKNIKIIHLTDWYSGLQSAQLIEQSRLLLGSVSCCNAMAEAMFKPSWMEQKEDCFNVKPTQCINEWSNEKVVEEVIKYVRQ